MCKRCSNLSITPRRYRPTASGAERATRPTTAGRFSSGEAARLSSNQARQDSEIDRRQGLQVLPALPQRKRQQGRQRVPLWPGEVTVNRDLSPTKLDDTIFSSSGCSIAYSHVRGKAWDKKAGYHKISAALETQKSGSRP
jgi:hypothetical protein